MGSNLMKKNAKHSSRLNLTKIIALAIAVVCLIVLTFYGHAGRQEVPKRSDIRYIFVHGLSGWGSYDRINRVMPYWGMFSGDLMKYLRTQGFSCYAASVSPEGSAWDRACELYAQLAGSVVDYGEDHSQRCGHERFGTDYSQDPLIPDWNDGGKIVLLGHSFGGATVRLFSELLANGSAEEISASGTEDISPFFRGGQGERIHALITLAAPTNGTTAYDMHEDENFDPEAVQVSNWDEWMGKLFSSRKTAERDGRSEDDYASFDMHIDNALALNARISTLPGTYYFAVPCSATETAEDGTQKPIRGMMEGMFRKSAAQMGCYTGITAGGFVIDDSWQENDGLVNTVSAMAPVGEPSEPYDSNHVESGIWYVMPTYSGDHMSLQGGMTRRNNIRPFYLELLESIDGL